MIELYNFFKHPISDYYYFDIVNKVLLWEDAKNKKWRIQHFLDLPRILVSTKWTKGLELKWQLHSDYGVFYNDNAYCKGKRLNSFNYDDYMETMNVYINNTLFVFGEKDKFVKSDLLEFDDDDNVIMPSKEYTITVQKKYYNVGYEAENPYGQFTRIKGSDEKTYTHEKIKFMTSVLNNKLGFTSYRRNCFMNLNTQYRLNQYEL